jgi:hypothetical protein
MATQSDTAAEEALLMELAELGMGLARKLHQAALATTDAQPLLALTTAYCNVSRGVRQSLALRARFAAAAPRAEAASPATDTPRSEAERPDWNEYERPDWHTPVPANERLDADPDACRARIVRDLTVVSRTPALAAIPALQPLARTLAGRAALLGSATLRVVDSS